MAELCAQKLFEMTGRSAVITGAGNGLGRMVARGFVANGATTLVLVDRNPTWLEDTRAQLLDISHQVSSTSTPTIHLVQGDLASEEELQRVISETIAALAKGDEPGTLDVLVHCAGVRQITPVTYTLGQSLDKLGESMRALPYSALETSFRINLFAQYVLTAGLIEHLGRSARQGGGRGNVICFSSVASLHFGQFAPAYQTSKAAVNHLVVTMAAEFSEFYVRVNAISPGLFPSDMNPKDPSHPNYNNMAFEREMPARRAGTEQEMVATALYLASAAGGYVTGQNLVVDGGRLLVMSGHITDPS